MGIYDWIHIKSVIQLFIISMTDAIIEVEMKFRYEQEYVLCVGKVNLFLVT